MAGRRRSTRLSSETDAREEGDRVVRRRSPRLHPQTHASEDGAGTIRRSRSRRGSLLEAPASLPDIDDVLWDILLHLPPHPSSPPRASAVCKRWQRVATDPQFLRCFHAHHRLLGAFVCSDHEVVFTPNLDPPGRTPRGRFCLGRYGVGDRRYDIYFLGYRHGRALLKDLLQEEFVVCDLVTGERRCVALPPKLSLNRGCINGAVLCAAGDQGHVHDGCHSGPYKVVMVSTGRDDDRSLACVYSSQSGIWGDVISAKSSCANCHACSRSSPSTLVGNIVYWVLSPINHGILEFDLNMQSLALIKGPWCTDDSHTHQIIQAEDGIVGLAAFSYPSFQMWQREVDCHGVTTWLLHKTVDMHNILRLPSQIELAWREMVILGYDEEVNGVIFLYADRNAYMVEVKSMQPKKLTGTHYMNKYHPFTSFYIPGGGPAAAVFTEFVALDQRGVKHFYVI